MCIYPHGSHVFMIARINSTFLGHVTHNRESFVTSTRFHQYKVISFGMKNAPATFQMMIHKVVAYLEGCKSYIDDIVVYEST